MSGYLVKIEVFIPADPRKPTSMKAASDLIAGLSNGPAIGCEWTVSEPRWIARRKTTTPSVFVVAQNGAGAVGLASEQAIPAADPLEIPENLRRMPR